MLASLIHLTVGLALVLLLRRPARRLFGAGPAFTLWLWPALLATLPWLPAVPVRWHWLPSVAVTPAGFAVAASNVPATAAGVPWMTLWLIGSIVALLRIALVYARLRRDSRPAPAELLARCQHEYPTLDTRRLRLHPQGPAVLWSWRSLILLPADFTRRFGAEQRALVLAHEQAHLARRDPLWSVLAEVASALLWFHPLAWLALPRFRLDQELACDERILRHRAHVAGSYARTLLASTGMDASPVLIPWLAEPQLKERLMMIRRDRTSTTRRLAGYLGMGLFIGGVCLAAQASPRTTEPGAKATQDLQANARMAPRYPKASIDNKEQGTVVLTVRVNPSGTVKAVDYDATTSTTSSANLIAAASSAAMQWHFNPAMKNGQPIESYARVPVTFSLNELPDPQKQPSEDTKKH
ncbi:M56 family metallopeptidase [Dyella sp.]|jgi:TonB family protein|uniref:M56 family metallopeptidase n=1 Tax=Dyella sp. TaxID=1869338 RepID=UPI002D773B58|nr:M56 family metallopeptidase [Dyella sp.]HET6432101.1 M56 family metallopeptidase [Dyella sp.]